MTLYSQKWREKKRLKILPNVLDRQFFSYQTEYEEKAMEILRSGWYVLGKELAAFESEFAAYTKSRFCVGLASGLDALWMAFRILGVGEGDEVIVQGNTYIASVMGITINGATPIFVEPNIYNNLDFRKIEEKITKKTKAVLVVHLYGQASQMDEIQKICKKNNLFLVEDCAQSHGAYYNGKMTGTFGDVGCFSFYPSKNLGGFGDGGAVLIQDEELDRQFRMYRNYGSEIRYHNKVVGANSRLDELQAGLLRVKLKHLDEFNDERKIITSQYLQKIKNPLLELPKVADNVESVWHQFVVRTKHRDKFQKYLLDHDIHTLIHYPIPPHLSEAYAYLKMPVGSLPVTERFASEIISLPLYNGMTQEEIDFVIENINFWRVNDYEGY